MITNPLFMPQNARAQYQPGMPASLAYALMPTENFAQKRADAALSVQYQSMLSGLADQAVVEKEKSLRDTQESLGTIDRQKILQPDMQRLNQMYTQKWRTQMEDEIVNKFGGDIVRFRRERQPYYQAQFDRQLASSPDFQQALNNKTNYALAMEDKAKGKLLMGNFDQNWADYATGKTNVLQYKGAYDAPKEGFDYFDKTNHPTNPYGYNGRPVEVSQSDLAAHLLSQGLSKEQAVDYMDKVKYQGGRYWKMDSQKPWDTSKDAWGRKVDMAKLGLTRSSQAEAVRHHLATEAAEKANRIAAAGSPTVVNEIYSPEGSRPAYKTSDGQVIFAKPGATGKIGEVLAEAAGINTNLNASTNYASGVQSLSGGQRNPDYDRKLHVSSVYEVHSTDFKQTYRDYISETKERHPFLFESVDPSVIYYYGDRPFIHAVARINGKPRQVAVSIPDNELVRGELINQAGIYNSKEEQRQFSSDQQTLPKRRNSVNTDIDNF